MTRRAVLASLVTLASLSLCSIVLRAQTPSPVVGKWQGTVTAEMGQMRIRVTLAEKAGVVSGTIENAHGTFTIAGGKLVDGAWVLPFKTGDGAKGQMTGKVSGDTFDGDWDFQPTAVGKFSMTRVKDGSERPRPTASVR